MAKLSVIPLEAATIGPNRRNLTKPLAERLAEPPAPGVRLFWLGQAGFVIEAAGHRMVIDPYLSDSLAQRYRGKTFSHQRMMPTPVDPAELAAVDLVLATHHHTDHMDAASLQPLLVTNPKAEFLAPSAARQLALDRAGIAPSRLVPMKAGDVFEPFRHVRITATPAAHEVREFDEAGNDRFLGYVMDCGGSRIWHSGDCVPFAGLVETVRPLRPDIALLPVNGRRPELLAQGVPGNFSVDEAIETALAIGAKVLIAHHYGMFEFNTAEPDGIDQAAARAPLRVVRATTGVSFDYA